MQWILQDIPLGRTIQTIGKTIRDVIFVNRFVYSLKKSKEQQLKNNNTFFQQLSKSQKIKFLETIDIQQNIFPYELEEIYIAGFRLDAKMRMELLLKEETIPNNTTATQITELYLAKFPLFAAKEDSETI